VRVRRYSRMRISKLVLFHIGARHPKIDDARLKSEKDVALNSSAALAGTKPKQSSSRISQLSGLTAKSFEQLFITSCDKFT